MRAEVYSELAKANISPSMREIQIATMLRLSMAIKVAEGTLLLECPLRSQNLAEWLQNAIRETYKIDSRIKRVSQRSGFMYCIRLEGREAKKLLVLSRLLDRKTKRIAEGFPAFVNIDDPTDWIFDTRVNEIEIKHKGKTYRRDNDTFDTWFSSGHW
ncbi:MAG: hypothetical protein II014_00275, partial [Bifidobacteriaceae bacterium]|nr:hypothetical protein [Bifidobacteriaceae bacterium]